MKDLVSVVIPVYNVKPWLGCCLDSILTQDYANLEIILVDDGSTDGSELLCEEYAKKDARIRVIHQKNQGLSEARNVGIRMCHGKYTSLIDSDDYVEDGFYSALVATANENNADLVVCDTVIEDGEGNFIKLERYLGDDILDGKQYLQLFFNRSLEMMTAWSRLYKTSVLQKLRFIKGRKLEDVFFMDQVAQNFHTICFAHKAKYHYRRHRAGSITQNKDLSTKWDFIYSAKHLRRYVYKHCPELVEDMERWYFWQMLYDCTRFLEDKVIEKRERRFWKRCRAYTRRNFRYVKNTPFKRRCLWFLFSYVPPVYRYYARYLR